jgi:hypothetical protein
VSRVRVDQEEEQVGRRPAQDAADAPRVDHRRVLDLQRSAGNAAVARLLQRDVDAMIADARRREAEADPEPELRDPSEWEVDPDDPMPDAGVRQDPPTQEEPAVAESLHDTGPAVQPMAQPSQALPELGGILHSGQRSFATGQPQDEVLAEADASVASQDAWNNPARPTAQSEVAGRRPTPRRFQDKVAETVASHAANIPVAGAADPGALAQQALAEKQQQVADAARRHQSNVQTRATRHQQAQTGKADNAGNAKPAETVDAKAKAERLKGDDAHDAMVKRDDIEARFTSLRDRAKGLRTRLTPGLRTGVDAKIAQSVDAIASGPAIADRTKTTATLDEAEQAIKDAELKEAAYSQLRAKAEMLRSQVDPLPQSAKRQINKKSLADIKLYAESKPLFRDKFTTAQQDVKTAELDIAKILKSWQGVRPSHDQLAALKVRRANPGFIDGPADAVIAEADSEDADQEYWFLHETLPKVVAAVERLEALDRKFNQLTTRVAHCLATIPGSVPGADQLTIANGVANRAASPDPEAAYKSLNLRLLPLEVPTIAQTFDTPRLGHQWDTATTGLDTLVQHGVVRRGKLHSLYSTNDDGEGFSAEYLVDGISDIVIHTHCSKDGTPRDSTNAAHWKPSSVKKLQGATHAIPNTLRDLLVDRKELVANKDFKRSK